MKLEIHVSYDIDEIEKLVNEYKLLEKKDSILTDFYPDGDVSGVIGEITMPLYFNDGTVACNFILVGYSSISFWRCIYTCSLLSKEGGARV